MNAAQLKAKGYDIQDGKILSATTVRIKTLTVMGLTFKSTLNKDGKVVQHEWRGVTTAQAEKLKHVLDPVTKSPYLKFAYVPLPKEIFTASNQVKEVSLADMEAKKGIVHVPDRIMQKNLKPERDSFTSENEEDELFNEFDKGTGEPEDANVFVPPTATENTGTQAPAQGSEGDADPDADQDPAPKGDDSDEDDKGSSAADIERKELGKKSKEVLARMAKDDLGLEISGKETKAELIEMIVG